MLDCRWARRREGGWRAEVLHEVFECLLLCLHNGCRVGCDRRADDEEWSRGGGKLVAALSDGEVVVGCPRFLYGACYGMWRFARLGGQNGRFQQADSLAQLKVRLRQKYRVVSARAWLTVH